MPLWLSVFLGIVQGLTEFLPVSSSGHLVIFQSLLSTGDIEESYMLFDILLHLGTMIAVIVCFYDDIVKLIREFFKMARDGFRVKGVPERRFIILLLLAGLPIVLFYPLKGVLEGLFSSTLTVGCALIVTALLLFLSEKANRGRKTEKTARYTDALFICLMQAFALIPGISRSGATISGGLFSGFDKSFAVKFSFILSLPIVLGANILSIPDALERGFSPAELGVYAAGVAAATVSGIFAIRFMRHIARRGSFRIFSVYCAAVGVLTILFSIMGR